MSFQRESHTDHDVVPIEDAHGVKRREMQDTYRRLGDHISSLVDFRRENLLSHSAKYNAFKNEGDAMMEECASQLAQMKDAWKRESEKMQQPLNAIGFALNYAKSAADHFETVGRDPYLNRLVDHSEFMKKDVKDILEDTDVAEVMNHFESVDDRDALESFSFWLPGWDVKVGLACREPRS